MKYLLTTTYKLFIFSEDISHRNMAKKMFNDYSLIRSAGFVHIKNGKFETFGRSESLNKEPEIGDSEIINMYMAEREK